MNKNDKYTNILLNDKNNKISSKLNASVVHEIIDNLYLHRKSLTNLSFITENTPWLSCSKPLVYDKEYIYNNVHQVFNASINDKLLNRLSGAYYNTYKRIYNDENKNNDTHYDIIIDNDKNMRIVNNRMRAYKNLSYDDKLNMYIDDESSFYGLHNEFNNIIKSLFIEIAKIYNVILDMDNFYHIHLIKHNNIYIICAHTLEYKINKNILKRDTLFLHNILGYIDNNNIFYCKPDNKYNELFVSYNYSIDYEIFGEYFMDGNNKIIHFI